MNEINKNKFERIIQTIPPFDKRNPNPCKNYGIGGLSIWFILKGKHGAISLHLGTKLYLAKQFREWHSKGDSYPFTDPTDECIDCWSVDYHSYKKRYKEQEVCNYNCAWLNDKPCYSDGGSLKGRDDKVVENYLEKGDAWIWEYLEKIYSEIFLQEKQ